MVSPPHLSLTPGARIGVYEVTAPIGEGGMGQVWRATDTTLGRQVAIKILPDAFASDPERLARFEREAKTSRSASPATIQMSGASIEAGPPVVLFEGGPAPASELSARPHRGATA